MTRKEQVNNLISAFNRVGIDAMYGGRKGHGFWLYDRKLEKTIVDSRNRSGNEFFWFFKDAAQLLISLQ